MKESVVAMPLSLLKICFISVCLLWGCTAYAQSEMPTVYTKQDVKLSKYQWQGEVPPRQRIRVINHFGNITTRNTNYQDIMLSGVIQKVGPNAPTPEVKISEVDGITIIEVVYQAPTLDKFNQRIGRLDLGVYAPKNVTIELETSFGDISGKKHQSDLVLTTQSGKIKLATRGRLEASTQSGPINAVLLRPKHADRGILASNKPRRESIRSVSGDIKLHYYPDNGIEFELHAGKGIRSKTADIQALIADTSNTLHFGLGNRARSFSVTSEQGAIEINAFPGAAGQPTLSSPSAFEGDVRELPKVSPWQPGDPVIEMQDGRSDIDGSRPKTREINQQAPKKNKQDNEE